MVCDVVNNLLSAAALGLPLLDGSNPEDIFSELNNRDVRGDVGEGSFGLGIGVEGVEPPLFDDWVVYGVELFAGNPVALHNARTIVESDVSVGGGDGGAGFPVAFEEDLGILGARCCGQSCQGY